MRRRYGEVNRTSPALSGRLLDDVGGLRREPADPRNFAGGGLRAGRERPRQQGSAADEDGAAEHGHAGGGRGYTSFCQT